MDSDVDARPAGSLFERYVSRQRPVWVTVAIGLLLVSLAAGAAALDGTVADFFTQGHWRLALLAPAVIVYILAVTPLLERYDTAVVEAFRSLVLLDKESFARLLRNGGHVSPFGEALALVAGLVFGAVGQEWPVGSGFSWLGLYLSASICLMLGLLAWAIYAAMAGSRLTRDLHRQPLDIDIFDTTPLKAVGRQSLAVALVFVGGILLSTLLTLGRLDLFAWQNWLIYLVLTLVPVLLFFLSMRDTHGVLGVQKRRELEAVQRSILETCRLLMARREAGEGSGGLAAEINALVAYEERLKAARTWPYDLPMLRTLCVSVVFPAVAAVGKVVVERLLE